MLKYVKTHRNLNINIEVRLFFKLQSTQDHSEGESKYFPEKLSHSCSGRACSLSAAGISICCLNLYTIMTSAPTRVITLPRTDRDGRNFGREEILWLGVHLVNSSELKLNGWINECDAVLSDSQVNSLMVLNESQNGHNRLINCIKKWELYQQWKHLICWHCTTFCIYKEIHHPRDIKTYRDDWSLNHSSWQALLLENKSSYSIGCHRRVNLNVSPFCSASLLFSGIRVALTSALWGLRVYWLS